MLVFIRRNNVERVRELARVQQQTEIIATLTTYYASRGSWDGITEFLGLPTIPPEGALPPFVAGTQPPPPPPPPIEGAFFPNSDSSLPPLFGLLDLNGAVRVPLPGIFNPGQIASSVELERAIPLKVDNEVVGYLASPEIPNELTPDVRAYVDGVNRALLTTAVISTAFALLLGAILSTLLTKPLRELTQAARLLAAGDRSQRVTVRSRDETGELAEAFNQMSSALELAQQQRRHMTADIAHDLRSPMTAVAGFIEGLRDGVFEPTETRLNTMHTEVEHVLTLINDLQALALSDVKTLALNRKLTQPQTLAKRAIQSFADQAQQRNVELAFQDLLNEPVSLMVDEERMARVLSNLVSNALRYTPPNGSITLSTFCDTEMAFISVDDTGQGISAEDLPFIFERFYRAETANTNQGNESGLGLAIAKAFVEAHGGSIRVASTPSVGTAFTISLPRRLPRSDSDNSPS